MGRRNQALASEFAGKPNGKNVPLSLTSITTTGSEAVSKVDSLSLDIRFK